MVADISCIPNVSTVLFLFTLTGLCSRPAIYRVFQCSKSSIRAAVLITPYLITCKHAFQHISFLDAVYTAVQTFVVGQISHVSSAHRDCIGLIKTIGNMC